jgi:glutamate-1-semialdehyde 2,1-aminomutase
MGLRSVTLGHAFPPVVEAAYRQMQQGINFTRPAAIEVECAQSFLDLIRTADMVKFAKNGSDVTTAAVKLARAFTGREMVAVCADQPFFSVDDWFIGSTEMSAGIPKSVQELTVKFRYNDPVSLASLFEAYPGRIACVILEPETTAPPVDNFLETVRSVCHEHGALLIFDEIITGFRWHLGGAQALYGVEPDLSTFGKALANGFSISALAGKKEIMELGGFNHDRERVFLLSTTYGAETHSMAAAIETMRIYREEGVIEYLFQQGEKLKTGIESVILELGLEGYFGLLGKACNLVYYTRDQEQNPSQAFRALLLQETLKRGILMPSLVVSYSHRDEEIDRTVSALAEALSVYQQALSDGVDRYLIGRPVKPVFRKYS